MFKKVLEMSAFYIYFYLFYGIILLINFTKERKLCLNHSNDLY